MCPKNYHSTKVKLKFFLLHSVHKGDVYIVCREQKYQYIYFVSEKREDSLISLVNINFVIFLVKNEENIFPGSKVLCNEKQG
jgi:hypothetical protein